MEGAVSQSGAAERTTSSDYESHIVVTGRPKRLVILCGMGSEVRSAGLPAGAAIEAMDSYTPGQQL